MDGRKVLFEDGVYAEYAVFTLQELEVAAFAAGPDRVAARRRSRRSRAAATRAVLPHRPEPVEWYVGEAMTNLYVGLHRDRRGERLSGMRLIQVPTP